MAGSSPLTTPRAPRPIPVAPKNKGIYARTKVPNADFDCDDPDGSADIASCTATVDGNPIASGDPLPDSIGTHTFVVTASRCGRQHLRPHPHLRGPAASPTSTARTAPSPTTGSARHRSGTQPMVDSSGNHHDGEYKNGTESGPIGIAGDGDKARRFTGADGYGYANGIAAPQFSSRARRLGQRRLHRRRLDRRPRRCWRALHPRRAPSNTGAWATTVDSHVAVDPGHWQQVVGTWDGVDIRIYIDGQLSGHGRVDQAALLRLDLLRRLRRARPLVLGLDRRGRLLPDRPCPRPRLPALARRPAGRPEQTGTGSDDRLDRGPVDRRRVHRRWLDRRRGATSAACKSAPGRSGRGQGEAAQQARAKQKKLRHRHAKLHKLKHAKKMTRKAKAKRRRREGRAGRELLRVSPCAG